MMKISGIDISHWNKVYDFSILKKYVSFIILKAGGGDTSYSFKDPMFEVYYEQCKKHAIPVGAYYYAPKDMDTPEKGKKASEYFLKLLYNKKFEMPVFLDLESTGKSQKEGATKASIAFCEALEEKGYFIGIYSSDISGFKERLDVKQLAPYTLWVARYGNKPSHVPDFGLWQYTSSGSVPGVMGYIDMDYAYRDYPKIIKGGRFNGYNS